MVITTTKYERLRREVLGTIWKVVAIMRALTLTKS